MSESKKKSVDTIFAIALTLRHDFGLLEKEGREWKATWSEADRLYELFVAPLERQLSAQGSYVPQDVALTMIQMLDGVGLGKGAFGNTLHGMVSEAVYELDLKRREVLAQEGTRMEVESVLFEAGIPTTFGPSGFPRDLAEPVRDLVRQRDEALRKLEEVRGAVPAPSAGVGYQGQWIWKSDEDLERRETADLLGHLNHVYSLLDHARKYPLNETRDQEEVIRSLLERQEQVRRVLTGRGLRFSSEQDASDDSRRT